MAELGNEKGLCNLYYYWTMLASCIVGVPKHQYEGATEIVDVMQRENNRIFMRVNNYNS